MSTNNAEGTRLNMNAHKNKWGEAKSISRIKKRVNEMKVWTQYKKQEDE
jgi:hypothetical protein